MILSHVLVKNKESNTKVAKEYFLHTPVSWSERLRGIHSYNQRPAKYHIDVIFAQPLKHTKMHNLNCTYHNHKHPSPSTQHRSPAQCKCPHYRYSRRHLLSNQQRMRTRRTCRYRDLRRRIPCRSRCQNASLLLALVFGFLKIIWSLGLGCKIRVYTILFYAPWVCGKMLKP